MYWNTQGYAKDLHRKFLNIAQNITLSFFRYFLDFKRMFYINNSFIFETLFNSLQ